METVYFTATAVILYLGADWILNRVEIARGQRFQSRSVIFFVILLVLALVSFTLIRQFGD